LFDLFTAALGASVWLVALLVAAHHLEDVLALPAFELIDWHVCVLVLGGLPFSIARLGEYDSAPRTAIMSAAVVAQRGCEVPARWPGPHPADGLVFVKVGGPRPHRPNREPGTPVARRQIGKVGGLGGN
jgi:hypothetical protein